MEEVPHTTPLEPSDVTFRDLTRAPGAKAPSSTKIADARVLIEERLADGKRHPSMIDELLEQGFSRSTAYDAAKRAHKAEWSAVRAR